MAARGSVALPEGVEAGLDAELVYDPPNLTFPFGAYVCVVDVDPDTAKVTVRRFVAVDDCGTRINPKIIEGQIHRGLTDGVGIALMEQLAFDDEGNCLAGSLMDYLIPTALEVPEWETDFTVTPCPHHPIGAKGVGESATVGSPPTIVNAICDALRDYGVRHVDMPCTPSRVWDAMQAARR
jgi:carbon-monoxide dehydrogenase large subunit